jgi:predicted S18 family serine protease
MNKLHRQLILGLVCVLGLAVPARAEQSLFIDIPTLSVTYIDGKALGSATFLVMQIDRLTQATGPDIQFNEGSRALGVFKGSALGADWKEAARTATFAATNALGEDPRTWRVTLKDVSTSYLSDGPSASAGIAVAMVAAVRGVRILPKTAITGAIDRNGRISSVGGLPAKLQAAAANGFSTVVIPNGQTRTREWDLRPQAESLAITIIEVSSLKDAYEILTGQPF